MAVIATPPFLYFTDDDGNPLSGGKIWTYRAGTSQLKNTFTDQSETTPATNPIVLDSAGRAVVWISGSYKFVITDAFDNIIRTVDNVTSFNVFQNEADSFFESLSGDGVETTFSLSSDLGTDENAIFVFTDNGMTNHVRNGGFDTDTIWTKGSGWSIGSGVATAAGAISTAIEQNSNITLNAGQAYVVTFTATRSAGSLTASVGGTNGTPRSAGGTFTEIIIAGSTQVLAFTGGGFTGTLDDVSIKPVMSSGANIIPPTQFTLNGTSITFANPPGDGTNNISVFAPSLLVASAAGSAAAAEQSADNAATSETNAAQSASDASDSADLAESWAIGDIVARPEGSAKAWAETASEITIPAGSLTLTKLAPIPANTILINPTGSSATPQAADQFAAMPIGVPFGVLDHLSGAPTPVNTGDAKFIKLTASDAYNTGLLTSESVTGTAPLVVATAVIDHAASPIDGQTVYLLNSENRYLMAGTSAGTVAHDQMQVITGETNNQAWFAGTPGAGFSGALSGQSGSATRPAAGSETATQIVFNSADSPNARTGDHTNVKHQQATYYMRIA